jgi:hypothetical protein
MSRAVSRLLVRVAAIACAGAVAAACGDKKAERAEKLATGMAAGLATALEAVEIEPAPHLCASWPADPGAGGGAAAALAGGSLATRKGARLTLSGFPEPARLAAVADSRGAGAIIEDRLAGLVEVWKRDQVAAVFFLGGMAETEDELHRLLAIASEPARWAVIAMPGDRESVSGLRGAVSRLAGEGRAVFDGSQVRIVELGPIRAVTLPGAVHTSHIIPGADGCLRRGGDAEAAGRELATHDGIRVWLAYAAHRQRGPVGSDLSDGVHAGELALRDAVATARPHLALHGQIELGGNVAMAGKGTERRPAAVAVGALEMSPPLLDLGTELAAGVIVTAGDDHVRWRRTHTTED